MKHISNGKVVSGGLHESLVPNSKISMIPFLLFHNNTVNIAKIHLFYCMMNNLNRIVSNFFAELLENYNCSEKNCGIFQMVSK